MVNTRYSAFQSPGANMGSVMDRMRQRYDVGRMYLVGQAESEPFEDFDCYYLCQSCQMLTTATDKCPACHEAALLDLRNHAYARSLQDIEREEREAVAIPVWPRLASWAVVLPIWVLSNVLFYNIPLETYRNTFILNMLVSWWLIFVAFVFPGISFGFCLALHKWLRKKIVHRFSRLEDARPLRWFGPVKEEVPNNDRELPLAKGVAAPEKVLKAPFSGRACLAYRAKVYLSTPEGMKQLSWLLDESKSAAFALGGMRVDANLCLCPTEPKLLTSSDLSLESDEIDMFLRCRGLFVDEGTLLFYESIVPPNASISIAPTGHHFVIECA